MATYSPLQGDEAATPLDPPRTTFESATDRPARTETPAEGKAPHSKTATKPSNVKGDARTLIILACFFSITPIIGLIIALLVIIFSNRVDRSTTSTFIPASELPQNETCASPAFLVDFNATTLVIPGTWISTIANLIAGLLMFLLSFSLARSIKDKSVRRFSALPTPKQLSLYIGLVGAGIGPLWDWAAYTFGWRKQRVRHMNREVKTSAIALLLLLILG